MRTLVLCAVLISLFPAALSNDAVNAITWGTADGADMCAGYIEACTDMKSCSAIAFGPCVGNATKPLWALSSYVEGYAFIDAATYLTETDPTKYKIIDPAIGDNNGYRDLNEVTDADGGKYGYMQTGAVYGSMADAGAYIGIAWYFNTGTTTLKSNMNSFYGATTDNQARVDRGGSTIGAPIGPSEVCIAARTAAGACGANLEYAPGAIKFSMYGYTAGSNFSAKVVKGQNGFPTVTSHHVCRTRVDAHGIQFTDIKLNGDKTFTSIGATSVSKITLIKPDGEGLDLDFPTTYNIGKDNLVVPDKTKTVMIKVSKVPDADAIFIDYLFEADDVMAQAAGNYFVYGSPVITAKRGATTTPTPSATTTSATTGTLSPAKMPLILVLMLCSVLISGGTARG